MKRFLKALLITIAIITITTVIIYITSLLPLWLKYIIAGILVSLLFYTNYKINS